VNAIYLIKSISVTKTTCLFGRDGKRTS